MDEIRYFNRQLNNSFEKRNEIHNNFKSLVDINLKSLITKGETIKQGLIIGAGKMDDFSLLFLMKYMDKIVLTDVDADSTKEAVEKLSISKKDRKRIHVKEIEYTGFQETGFFNDFVNHIIKFHQVEEIDMFIDSNMKEIKKYKFLPHDKEKCEFIYISPIYTQLVYNQVLMECSILRQSGYPEHLIKHIEQKMLEEMTGVIDRFNTNVVSLLKNDGKLFVLSDIFEVNIGSDFDLRIASGIKNKEVMDQIYTRYSEKYGIGLGDYGLYNLDEKIESELSKWLIWPFKEDTNLIIKLKVYKKKLLTKEV